MNMDRFFIYIFPSIGIGLLIIAAFVARNRAIMRRTWPLVQAQVVSTRLVVKTDEDGTAYYPSVTFTFATLQQPGIQRVSTWERNYSTGNQKDNEKYLADFPAGSKHNVRYDPDHPEKIQYDSGSTLQFYMPALVLVMVGAAFFFIDMIFVICLR